MSEKGGCAKSDGEEDGWLVGCNASLYTLTYTDIYLYVCILNLTLPM